MLTYLNPLSHFRNPTSTSSDRTRTSTTRPPTRPPILTNIPATLPKHLTNNARETTRHARLLAAAAFTSAWPAADAELYTHIQLRGLEPLLPKSMEADFPALPSALFTVDEGGVAAVLAPRGGGRGGVVRAARVLEELLGAGAYVRDLVGCERVRKREGRGRGRSGANAPEVIVERAVLGYNRWALGDSGVDGADTGFLGCLVIVRGSGGEDVGGLQERLVRGLQGLRGRWEERLGLEGEAPPLYGVLCTGSVVVLVSLRDEHENEEEAEQRAARGEGEEGGEVGFDAKNMLRILAAYNFMQDPGQDVWIAFSIAMLIVHSVKRTREALFGAEAVGEGGDEDVRESVEETDYEMEEDDRSEDESGKGIEVKEEDDES